MRDQLIASAPRAKRAQPARGAADSGDVNVAIHDRNAPGEQHGVREARSARAPSLHARAILLSSGYALMLALIFSASARAQEPRPEPQSRWLVMPALVAAQNEPLHPARAAARLLGKDLRAHGKRAFTIEEAKTQFEQHGSTPPMTASTADIDELARDAQRALYHVASGLPARAKQDVERALERARRALESLNRETRAAQHLLDACLFLVRAHLQHGNRAAARNQALECRRLVPDILPDGTVHPPDVIGVFAEAQAALIAHEPAALRIESDPVGCAAYVNGRNLGPTPRELSQLSPGEYRIQVECDAGMMGRVHRVSLANNRLVVRIDTRYDRAIETLFDLSLTYANREQAAEYAGPDAIETARVMGATDVVLATSLSAPGSSPARVRLDRYRVADGVPLARVEVSVVTVDKQGTIGEAELERARVALSAKVTAPLVHRKPVREAPPEDRELAAQPAPEPADLELARDPPETTTATPAGDAIFEPDRPADRSDAWPIVGYVLGGIGLVGHATSWALYARELGEQNDYTAALNAPPPPEDDPNGTALTALGEVEYQESAPVVIGALSSMTSTIALPLWLPRSKGIPWWGWTVGATGLVLGTVGTALAVGEGSCQLDHFDRCTEPAQATHLGAMLMLQAVPLLAVPVVQGIRSLTGTELRVAVGSQGAMLRIKGQL